MDTQATKYFDVYLENEKNQHTSDTIAFDGSKYRLAKNTNVNKSWNSLEKAIQYIKLIGGATGFGVVSVVAR